MIGQGGKRAERKAAINYESKMEKNNMGNPGGAAVSAAFAFYGKISAKCLSIRLYHKTGRWSFWTAPCAI